MDNIMTEPEESEGHNSRSFFMSSITVPCEISPAIYISH